MQNYSDYDGLEPAEKDNTLVDFDGYDNLNNYDPFDYLDIPKADTNTIPFEETEDFKYLSNFDTEAFIQRNADKRLNKQAEEIGINAEHVDLAKSLNMLKTGDENPVITIPQGILDSAFGRFSQEVANSVQFPLGTTVLTGLSCFSAVANLCYSVLYPDGTPLPIGLYVCASQPPGTGKSRLLNIYQSEFNKRLGITIRRIQEENQRIKKDEEMHPIPSTTMSNATPEAIDSMMNRAQSGRFAIVSSEQGAIDRILNIGVKDRTTDNDLVLKGFVGEHHGSARVGRACFMGEVFGSITMLSQNGTAMKVIQNSGGQGIAERFMFAQEPSLLGYRTNRPPVLSKASRDEYNRRVRVVTDRYSATTPRTPDMLLGLRFCDRGYAYMEDLHDVREPMLKHYNDSGSDIMTGALSKIDQQIMKIAGTLHVYETMNKGGQIPQVIDFHWVEQATFLAFQMLSKLEDLLQANGEMGQESRENMVLDFFNKHPKAKERQITDALKNHSKFQSRAAVKHVIDKLIEEKKIIKKDGFLKAVLV